MNRKQKKVLIAIAAAVLGMLLYPPFHWVLKNGQESSLGYRWIFVSYDYPAGTVDIELLITQWIAVCIVGGIAYLILKDH